MLLVMLFLCDYKKEQGKEGGWKVKVMSWLGWYYIWEKTRSWKFSEYKKGGNLGYWEWDDNFGLEFMEW